jgi:hypothetical protein
VCASPVSTLQKPGAGVQWTPVAALRPTWEDKEKYQEEWQNREHSQDINDPQETGERLIAEIGPEVQPL